VKKSAEPGAAFGARDERVFLHRVPWADGRADRGAARREVGPAPDVTG